VCARHETLSEHASTLSSDDIRVVTLYHLPHRDVSIPHTRDNDDVIFPRSLVNQKVERVQASVDYFTRDLRWEGQRSEFSVMMYTSQEICRNRRTGGLLKFSSVKSAIFVKISTGYRQIALVQRDIFDPPWHSRVFNCFGQHQSMNQKTCRNDQRCQFIIITYF